MNKKRLERDKEKAVVSGVLAGLSNYFGQDPLLFRIIAITFLILTGVFPGVLIYLMAVLMIPKKVEHGAEVEYEVVEDDE